MTDGRNEPTLNDVITAITALAAGQEQLTANVEHISNRVDGVADSQQNLLERLDALEDRMLNRIDQVRADIAGLKVDVGILERYQRDTAEAVRRHLYDGDAHHRHAA